MTPSQLCIHLTVISWYNSRGYIRMYVCTYVLIDCLCTYVHTYICVDITVRFNQSAYNVTENSGIIQLFLILSSPSSFNETVQLISNDVDTDNSANGMIRKLPEFML